MSQSWSALRKQLEQEFLCEKLRGRLTYFFTVYHNAPDHETRLAIRVDGKEVFRANSYNEGFYYKLSRDIKRERGIPMRHWDGKHFLNDEENRQAEDEAVVKAIQLGKIDSHDVRKAIRNYIELPIRSALESDDLLVRMFAILDRRVGKRTLKKLTESYSELPDWLRQFYILRFEAEEILYNENLL